MVTTRRRRLATCASAALLGVGCRAPEPLPEFDETPAVALLIMPELPRIRWSSPASPDTGLYATLVTTGTPVRSPYLRADRFEMRRVSDGARFAWRPFPTRDEVVREFPRELGNYFLPRATSAAGLGWDSIAPGAVYELIVDAGPFRLGGRTRVPDPVEFVREPADGDTIVRWRSSRGAALYSIGGDIYYGPLRRIADTAVVIYRPPLLPGQPAFSQFIRVFALDSNYAAFSGDLRASQAGIAGGWGVFGSHTWAEMELPPRGGSPPP